MSNESKTRVERLRENFQADMTGSVPLAFAEKILGEAEAEAATFKDQRDASFEDVVSLQGCLDRVTAERDELKAKLDAHITMHRLVLKERDEARVSARIAHAGRDDVWFWEGTGHDDPESLSCPVVMGAETLREFVEKAERLARYEADGPALLTAEHAAHCRSEDPSEQPLRCRPGCTFEGRDAAYREQHARDVALLRRVERAALVAVDLLKEREWRTKQEEHATARAILAETQFLAGVRACLQALREGAAK